MPTDTHWADGACFGIPIPGASGEPSFAIGVSIVHPTGSADERDTILDALRGAADSLTRPRLLTA